MKRKQRPAALFAAALIACGLQACGQRTGENQSVDSGTLEGTRTVTNIEFDSSSTVQQVLDKAEVVAKGCFVEQLDSINLDRSGDSGRFVEGAVYVFEVDDYLKGSGEDRIQVVLMKPQEGTAEGFFSEPLLDESVILSLVVNRNIDLYEPSTYPYEFRQESGEWRMHTEMDEVKEGFEDEPLRLDAL